MKRKDWPLCGWCGQPRRPDKPCSKCNHLDRLLAEQTGGGEPLSETQLGMRPPYRIDKRLGRRELY